MLPENDRFRDLLGVTAWHKAGYTGTRGLAASGEDFSKDTYHKRATLAVFREIAPDSEIIYPLTGTSMNVLGVSAFAEAAKVIAEKGVDAMFGSYSGGDSGEKYDDILRPVSDFCTIFLSAGNDAEESSNPALKCEYIYGAGACDINGVPQPYTSVTDYVDFCAPAGLFIECNGNKIPFGGTSCAAPVLAGMARLVNDFFIDKTGFPLSSANMYRFFVDNCRDVYTKGEDDKTGFGLPILPPPESIDIERYHTMLNSRDVEKLRPDVAANCKKFVEIAKTDGWPVLVTGTVRDDAYQQYCYANGTSNTPIPSFHSVKAGLAFDICKNVKGHEYDDPDFWAYCGTLGQKMGFEWGGAWKSITDKPHFQWSEHGKYTSSMIRAGQYPPDMPLYEEVIDLTKEETQALIDETLGKTKEAVYATSDDIPEWGRDTVNKLMAKGALSGDGNGLNIPYSMLRILVINDRSGLYDKEDK